MHAAAIPHEPRKRGRLARPPHPLRRGRRARLCADAELVQLRAEFRWKELFWSAASASAKRCASWSLATPCSSRRSSPGRASRARRSSLTRAGRGRAGRPNGWPRWLARCEPARARAAAGVGYPDAAENQDERFYEDDVTSVLRGRRGSASLRRDTISGWRTCRRCGCGPRSRRAVDDEQHLPRWISSSTLESRVRQAVAAIVPSQSRSGDQDRNDHAVAAPGCVPSGG